MKNLFMQGVEPDLIGQYQRGLLQQVAPNIPPPPAPSAGILPVAPEKPQGFLAALMADPRQRAALMGMSQALLEAGQWRAGPRVTGAEVLGGALKGYQQGAASWEEQQARESAARLNEEVKRAELAKFQREAGGGASFAKASGVGINPQTGQAEVYQLADNGEQIWTGIVPAETFSYQNAGDQIIGLGSRGGRGPAIPVGVDPTAVYNKDPNVIRAGAAAQAEGAAEGAAGVAERKDAQTQSRTADRILSTLDEAEKLLPLASSGMVQAAGTAAARAINKSTQSGQADTQLDIIAAELVGEAAKTKILGINPTNVDLEMYRKAVGDLNNPLIPTQERLAALQYLRKKYQQNAQQAAEQSGGAGAQSTARRLRWNPQTDRLE